MMVTIFPESNNNMALIIIFQFTLWCLSEVTGIEAAQAAVTTANNPEKVVAVLSHRPLDHGVYNGVDLCPKQQSSQGQVAYIRTVVLCDHLYKHYHLKYGRENMILEALFQFTMLCKVVWSGAIMIIWIVG